MYPTLNGDPYNIDRAISYNISKFYVNNISLGYYAFGILPVEFDKDIELLVIVIGTDEK